MKYGATLGAVLLHLLWEHSKGAHGRRLDQARLDRAMRQDARPAAPVRRNRLPALPSTRTKGVTTDHVEAGFWLFKYGGDTAEVPARIWLCDHEPDNPDNVLDTGPIWRCEINGAERDPYLVMHGRKRPISAKAYRFRMAERAWLDQVHPEDPKVNARKRVKLADLPLPF